MAGCTTADPPMVDLTMITAEGRVPREAGVEGGGRGS